MMLSFKMEDASDESDDESFDELLRTIKLLYESYCMQNVPCDCVNVLEVRETFQEGDLHKIERWIESGERGSGSENYHRCFALHLAIERNDTKILEYLLARGDIEVDRKYPIGITPLYLATSNGHIECVEKLIQAGSDINSCHCYGTPLLHESVQHPDICHLLIRQGALIDAVDVMGGTALDKAVHHSCIETLNMLLYYNADANVRRHNGFTPFMTALVSRVVDAQEALIEYVDDFNTIGSKVMYFVSSLLICALHYESPFVKDIIERGADVNSEPIVPNGTPFAVCVLKPVDSAIFKLVWERLRYNERTVDLVLLVDNRVPTFLPVIIESNNFEPAVEFFSKRDNYFAFVKKFVEREFDFNHLTALTCRLLEYGFRASSYDIYAIFSNYGFCELFRILLYMDNDYLRGWLPRMALCRLILDVNYDLDSLVDQVDEISKEAVLQLLEYSICPRLVDGLTLLHSDDDSFSAILSRLPKVPSLIELARNAARKQIWQAFKITNNCQFYTTIDHLDVPLIYKDILTFKKKTYWVK